MLAGRLLNLIHQTTLTGTKLPKGVGVLDPLNGGHAGEVRRIVELFEVVDLIRTGSDQMYVSVDGVF